VVRPPAKPGVPSRLALGVLVAIAVLAPWPYGAVLPGALLAVTALALLGSSLSLLAGAWRGTALPAVPLWPLAGFLGLVLLQLAPLAGPLHALLAPGSHAVWHPALPEAAAVLGSAARPASVDPDTTLRALALGGGLALLALLAAPALSRPGPAVRAAGVVAASGFVLSAYAIFARARFGALLYGTIAVPTVSPFGPFVNKNHFAGWAAMAALLVAGLAFGLADRARGRGGDWTADPRAGGVVLAIVAALAMALAGLVSLSRGGAVALAAGGTCLVALRLRAGARRGRSALLPSLVLAGALGTVLVGLVPQAAHERFRTLSGASFRLETWRDSLRLAAASPVLGHGLGAFHDAYPRWKRGHGIVRVEHAENDYLETLAETGVPGLALALSGLALLLAAAGRGIASGADRSVRGIGIGAVSALVAIAVHSALDFDLRIPSNAALAALAAAAAAGAAGVRPRPLPRAAGVALGLGAAALLAAVVSLPDRPWLAARREAVQAASAADPAVRHLRLERAEAALGRVLDRRPAMAESWLLLAGTRAARGDAGAGAALAKHALWLDPQRTGLGEAAGRLGAAAAATSRPE
jgi:O-antigen ligase